MAGPTLLDTRDHPKNSHNRAEQVGIRGPEGGQAHGTASVVAARAGCRARCCARAGGLRDLLATLRSEER